MTEQAEFTPANVLQALQRICREQLSGNLSFPRERGLVTWVFSKGRLVDIDSLSVSDELIPFLTQKGLDVEPLVAKGLAGLPEAAHLRPALVEFFSQLINAHLKSGKGGDIHFQLKSVDDPGEGRGLLDIAAFIPQFFTKWLDGTSLQKLQLDPAAVIRVPADLMTQAAKIAIGPQQAFVLTRLQDGLKQGEVAASCGLPEDQVQRAMQIFLFFELVSTEKSAPRQPFKPSISTSAPLGAGSRPASRSSAANAPNTRGTRLSADEIETLDVISPQLLSEIEDLIIIAEKKDYYALLDLSMYAELDEIKKRYMDMAKKFHPDKFQKFNDTKLQTKVDAIFASITEAYELLKDPSWRNTYHEKILASRGTSPETSQSAGETAADGADGHPAKPPAYENREHQANQHFVHGREAFRVRKYFDATEHFREAVRIMPEVAEYQYMLGKTLSLNPHRLKEAEERFLQAIKLKPGKVEFILELAFFYDKINLKTRARKYYESVLKLDPENDDACHALGIKKKKKAFQLKNLLKIDLKDLLKGKSRDKKDKKKN